MNEQAAKRTALASAEGQSVTKPDDQEAKPFAEHTPQGAEGRASKQSARRGAEAEAVDMVATARAVQQTSDRWQASGALKLIAPAKVNLFLGIGSRRDDGYHEATNVMHAITLHDVLYLRRAPASPVSADGTGTDGDTAGAATTAFAGPSRNVRVDVECLACEGLAPLSVPAEENIVFKAVDALARELGRDAEDAVEIRLEKHIPHQAGLGGGSSDAAAALLGMARLWGVSADDPALERVAHRLGSDVAVFLHGECACFGGTGERFDRELAPTKGSLVLIKPAKGVSTAAAYGAFDEDPQAIDQNMLAAVRGAACAAEVPLCNNLAAASGRLMPELEDVRAWAFARPETRDVLLCGSGSATFALVDSLSDACRLAAAAQAKGWWARSTTFGSLKAALVPR